METSLFEKFVKLPVQTQVAVIVAVLIIVMALIVIPGAATNLFNLAVGIKVLAGK